MKQRLQRLMEEVELAVRGEYSLELAESLLGQGEYEITFEQISTAVTDTPVEIGGSVLEELKQIAVELGNTKHLGYLSVVDPDSSHRTWLDQESNEAQAVPTDAVLRSAAEDIRNRQAVDEIVKRLTDLTGKAPTGIQLTRFIRMIAPQAPFTVATNSMLALTNGDDVEIAANLLAPFLTETQ